MICGGPPPPLVPDGEETGLGEQMLTLSFQEGGKQRQGSLKEHATQNASHQPRLGERAGGYFLGARGPRTQRCVLCALWKGPQRGWHGDKGGAGFGGFQGKPAMVGRRRCQQPSGNLSAEAASPRKVVVHLIFLLWVVPQRLSLSGLCKNPSRLREDAVLFRERQTARLPRPWASSSLSSGESSGPHARATAHIRNGEHGPPGRVTAHSWPPPWATVGTLSTTQNTGRDWCSGLNTQITRLTIYGVSGIPHLRDTLKCWKEHRL